MEDLTKWTDARLEDRYDHLKLHERQLDEAMSRVQAEVERVQNERLRRLDVLESKAQGLVA